ncbi:MAG: hypothetical protein A3I66_05770 [Burkholderiales bacterium RIFCSPLOWO2_02_FULL_57_36]|nr:MAG: hypothetical protein A3I66_05770 [Burkholderiales bacterium RIFCSPLOWO2_02_FULL_57_36]
MTSELLSSPLTFAAIVFGVAGAILLFGAIVALVHARPLRFALRTLSGLLMLSCALLASGLAIGLQGYQAFTREEAAARLTVKPLGPQRFSATMRFADGREATYELAGDEVYVDAHILKWHPYANLLGLHTSYELDRLAGRYHGIEQERSAPRTIHSLAQDKPIDLFGLRRRHEFLAPMVDAQYGSAAFVPVDSVADFEILVSTTGLLMRKVEPENR